jgi:tetratricopeptide (TPR) repeat protein
MLEKSRGVAVGRGRNALHAGIAYRELGRLDEAADRSPRRRELAPPIGSRLLHAEARKVLLEAREPRQGAHRLRERLHAYGWWLRVLVRPSLRLAVKHLDATRVLAETIDADPQLADAHGQLGVTYWQLGREADAIAAMRRAANLSPDQPQWHVNLALALGGRAALKRRAFP